MMLRARSRLKYLPIGLAVLAFGCGAHDGAGTLPAVKMQIGSKNFEIEVAATRRDEEKGLMRRDSMADDHGMIFVLTEEKVVNFWMKDVRFNLDILFLDHSGNIVSIHQMKAYDDRNYTSSDEPAKYAIELNSGAATAAGVKIGDKLQIPAAARDAKTN